MRLDHRFIFPLLVALLVGVPADNSVAAEEWRFPTDKITAEQYQAYLEEVRAITGSKSYEVADQLVVEAMGDNTIYVFTMPKHPAHPAVVKRKIVQKGDGVYILRQGHYAGSRSAYDRWWHEFDALDDAIRQDFRKKRGP